MSVFSVVLILHLSLSYLSEPAKGTASKPDIVEITDDYFDLKIRKYLLAIVMFYAPWCGHCKQLKPHFESAAKKLAMEDPPVVFARVDCTDRGKISCARFGVRSFPVLKIFKDGDYYDEYNGPRDEGGIFRKMASLARVSPRKLDSSEDVNKFRNYFESVIIGFFLTDSTVKDIYLKISNETHDKIRYGITNNKALADEFGVTDGIAILRPSDQKNAFESDYLKYEGKEDTKEIQKWIVNNLYSLVDLRTRVNMNFLRPPIVVIYCDISVDKLSDPNIKYWRNKVLQTASKYKQQFKFFVTPFEEFDYELKDFGLEYDPSKNTTPIVTVRTANGMKYSLTDELSQENLENFLQSILKNEIKPYIKSDPIPQQDEGPVKIAVGDNFDEVVTNNGKDTFIEFYAPWCTHCKKLAPIWKKLGERMKEDEVEIVKMDASSNDVFPPYEINGFPTIYWAGKNSKSKPEKYEGRRSLKEMIKFIAQRADVELKKYNRNGDRRDKGQPTKVELADEVSINPSDSKIQKEEL